VLKLFRYLAAPIYQLAQQAAEFHREGQQHITGRRRRLVREFTKSDVAASVVSVYTLGKSVPNLSTCAVNTCK
jgi:hypothetical protein